MTDHIFDADEYECLRCQGSNFTLTYDCPGRPLTLYERQQIYFQELDYKDGEWDTFPPIDNGGYT